MSMNMIKKVIYSIQNNEAVLNEELVFYANDGTIDLEIVLNKIDYGADKYKVNILTPNNEVLGSFPELVCMDADKNLYLPYQFNVNNLPGKYKMQITLMKEFNYLNLPEFEFVVKDNITGLTETNEYSVGRVDYSNVNECIVGNSISPENYVSEEWHTGDVITSGKMNNMVNGINKGIESAETAYSFANTAQNTAQSASLKADTAINGLAGKANIGHTHTKTDITDFPTKLSEFQNDIGAGGTGGTGDGHTHDNMSTLNNLTQFKLEELDSKPSRFEFESLSNDVSNNTSSLAEITKNFNDHVANHPSGDLSNYYNKTEVDKKITDIVLESGNLVFRDVIEGEIFKVSTVYVPPEVVNVSGVTLNKSTTIIPNGSNETLIATVLPSNATNKNVTWSSSNTAIATVNDGLITGVANGSCVITVTTVDGSFTATCNVTVETVTIPITSISLNKSTSSLEVGKSEQLTVTFNPSNATNKNVIWSSNDETKATVLNGLVTAKAEGSLTITATSQDGSKTATCSYTITQTVVSNELTKINIINEVDNTYTTPIKLILPNTAWATQTNYSDTIPWFKLTCLNATAFFNQSIIACTDTRINCCANYTSTNFMNTSPPAITVFNNSIVIKATELTDISQCANFIGDTSGTFNLPTQYEKLIINGSSVIDHTARTSGVVSGFVHFKSKLNNFNSSFLAPHTTATVTEYYTVQTQGQNIYGANYRTMRLTTDGYLEVTVESQYLPTNNLESVQAFLNQYPIVLYRKVA